MSNKIKFKRKAFGKIFLIRKKLFYIKRNCMCRKTFFSVMSYIFEKCRRVQEKYYTNIDERILMLCTYEAPKPPD